MYYTSNGAFYVALPLSTFVRISFLNVIAHASHIWWEHWLLTNAFCAYLIYAREIAIVIYLAERHNLYVSKYQYKIEIYMWFILCNQTHNQMLFWLFFEKLNPV